MPHRLQHSFRALARKSGRLLLLPFLAAVSCTNIDCPLDNVVGMTCTLYASETRQSLTLPDTLTIRVAGSDSILLNRAVGRSSFELPLRHVGEADTLLLRFSNAAGQYATDSLIVHHARMPHFENLDCPAAVFHRIESVRWTAHPLRQMPLTIDSVAVIRSLVAYESHENLRLYLRTTASQ